VFRNRVVRRLFGLKRGKYKEAEEKWKIISFLIFLSDNIRVTTLRRIIGAEHVACME
jgi:hypothetical protein